MTNWKKYQWVHLSVVGNCMLVRGCSCIVNWSETWLIFIFWSWQVIKEDIQWDIWSTSDRNRPFNKCAQNGKMMFKTSPSFSHLPSQPFETRVEGRHVCQISDKGSHDPMPMKFIFCPRSKAAEKIGVTANTGSSTKFPSEHRFF